MIYTILFSLVAAASAAPSIYGLNQLYNMSSRQADTSVVLINADSSYTPFLLINGTHGQALSGTFVSSGNFLYFSPPIGLQDSLGLYEINTVSQSFSVIQLTTPSGGSFAGNFALYDIEADPQNPGNLVALMTPQNPSASFDWAAIVEISPSSSQVTLRYNLTADELGWAVDEAPYGAYDPVARNFFLYVDINNAATILTVPLNGIQNASSLVNASIPTTPELDILGMDWIPAINSVVFVTANHAQQFGLATFNPYISNPPLSLLTTFNASFGLSGLDEIVVDPTGRYVYSIYGDFDPNTNAKLVPVVDSLTGNITKTFYLNMTDPVNPATIVNSVFGLAFV
jgi:hypothetical protein